jgi:DNA-binding CsgD family transcriptional regulator
VFGTILSGIIISDNKGNIIQHINKDKGLQNNTVLSVFTDKDNNLWLGLDNGIDYVEINSPITFISGFEGLGTGYCCRIFNGKIYLGTNQGLYVKPFDNFSYNDGDFELVKNSVGQVWSLTVMGGQLICGHNFGTFIIENQLAKKISNEAGAWKYISLKNHPGYLLGGHYNGLVLLKESNQGWNFDRKIKGFNESSRFLFEDKDGLIWISHGTKGIFKVTLSENMDSVIHFRLYTKEDGLPSTENNNLFEYKGKEYVSTTNGIYSYDAETDTFFKDPEMMERFHISGRIKTFETDDSESIWFIAEHESGVLRLNEDMTFTKITAPFKQLDGEYVNEFEFIYPYSNEHVFIGLDNGFAHYSTKFPKSYSKLFSSFITKVELPYIDSTLTLKSIDSSIDFQFPFKKNAFRFYYTAPFYENLEQLKFSYFLENYSDDWSPWTKDTYKDFTNLPEGEYSFKLKAQNIYGVESDVTAFKFSILPPWYRSTISYYIYFLLIVVVVFLSVKYILHRLELSKKKEEQKHKLELQKKEEQFQHQTLVSEKEIIRLRNEKLKNEMLHRDKELANQTMSIIQKNKFLTKLKDELLSIQKSTPDAQLKTKFSAISKRINKEIDNKQQNQIFETYFDEVHEEFFERLKKQFPQLSPREMRLCAYIRMNLSSKEIAVLLNIGDRGVEIGRYRLRKKLELPRETSLSTYLSHI